MNWQRTALVAVMVPVALIVMVVGFVMFDEADTACVPDGVAAMVDPASVPAGPIAGFAGEQLVNAAHIMAAGASMGLTVRDQQIGVMTAIGESTLRALDFGDAAGPDSRGLFQQRDNGAWGTYEERMDPYRSALAFFRVLSEVSGREAMEPTLVANAVQRNADPYHYRPFWEPAGLIVQGLAGVQPAGDAASASTSPYEIGPVRPQTAVVANTVGAMFGIRTVGGWRDPATEIYDPQGHPAGLALDFMINDITDGTAVGDRLAEYLMANATDLGVAYIIWQQRIWSPERPGEGWRLMEDRGSPTQNHMDHVHLSLTGDGSSTLAVSCTTPTSPGQVNGQGWSAPSDAAISSGFGARWGGMHYGTDFAASCDAPIWAASSGTVTFAGPASGYGNWIKISHEGDVVTTYGHMYTAGLLVRTGDLVQAGQQIGAVGAAGDSTGCHLHFEVLVAGSYVDPRVFLAEHGVQTGMQS